MPYETREELLASAKIDPEFDAFIKANPLPNIDYGDIAAFKQMSSTRTALTLKMLGEPPSNVRVSKMAYTARDGYKITAKVFQPTVVPRRGSPLIVMFHGGGWCIGSPEGEEQSCIHFVQAFGAVCISAAYRLGPEHKFPLAINDAWDATQWAATEAKSLGADPFLGFVVGGTSAGANMSAAIAHLARNEKMSPPLTGQYLAVPQVAPAGKSYIPQNYQHMYLSMEQNWDAPILPRLAIDTFTDAYDPDLNDPRYNVLGDPSGHADLPPVYFQVAGLDPLRDDAIIYEKLLREEHGIKTKMDVYDGLPHGYWGHIPALKKSSQFRSDMVQGMGWLLGIEAATSTISTKARDAQT